MENSDILNAEINASSDQVLKCEKRNENSYESLCQQLNTKDSGDHILIGKFDEQTHEAETEEPDKHIEKVAQIEENYRNEYERTHSLEQQVRVHAQRIEKLTLQLNEVKLLNRADSTKMGIFVTQEGIRIMVYKANILQVDVDCIVSATSRHLHHGNGIARIIANAAGPSLVEECKQYICAHGTLPVGHVCSTTAGQLQYKCVIHAHGPVWHDYDKNDSESLRKCENHLMMTVINSFYKAESKGMKSIALPAISSATSAVPIKICVKQYVRAVQEYSSRKKDLASALSEIRFIDTNRSTVGAIQDAFIEGIQPLGFKDK